MLISGTDGVGTKLRIAMLLDKHDTIGIDCVAMCVNDVICAGAKPLVFLDYIACGRNVPEKIAEIVKGVAEGCVQAGCSLVGGETAEHPGMMPEEDYDLAGFTVGVVDKEKILSNETMIPGDVMIALPSTGVHSNGFSLVRHVFNIDADLRFFTVYGPAGRPDMAYFGFTDKLLAGKTIEIFNYGNCKRDFTYIDDIVEGVKRVMQAPPKRKVGEDGLPLPPYKVYNIGNSHPENLLDFVTILQEELLRAGVLPADYDFEAHKKLVPMQPGDVPVTYADTTPLERDFGFKPSTPLREGLRKFAEWYKKFYHC